MSSSVRHAKSKSISESKALPFDPTGTLGVLAEEGRTENQEGQKISDAKTICNIERRNHLISLEQNVQHLQTKLTGQRITKEILEQALGEASSVQLNADGRSVSQHANRLIKDIALLELEVVHLEQYLLSLYRKAFEAKVQEQACVSNYLHKEEISSFLHNGQPHKDSLGTTTSAKKHLSQQLETPRFLKKRSQAKSGSLLFRKFRATSDKDCYNHDEVVATGTAQRKPRTSYSQPITVSGKEAKGSASSATTELWQEMISADANASSNVVDASIGGSFVFESPNKLSEELVRCMAAIYCKLADPPIPCLGSISPSPSGSSMSTASSKDSFIEGWSPKWRKDAFCHASPRQWRFASEDTSPYTSMVAVHWISVDNDTLIYAEKMLQNFRYLVCELERLNPGTLKHEEKLAFWLNIYNALMMHAYLAYGISKSHTKRIALLQKASYKIGSYSINAHTIEHNLLGCKSNRPVQWVQTVLSPVSKLRAGRRQSYALDKAEPLACFAVCCGGYSDPAVRVYTAKNVYQELDAAKREFLQANIIIRKDNKVLMPKVLEAFARESAMSMLGLLEWICQNVTEHQRKDLRTCMKVRSNKCIEWTPYNFTFRYLFVRDLARWFPPNS